MSTSLTFCRSAMRAKPSRASRAALALPTPKMKLTGLGARNAGASLAPSTANPARLVEIGSDLGEKFVAGEPDRYGDRQLLLHFERKARQHFGGRQRVQARGAGQIEERLIDRERLDQRRERKHHLADLAPNARILFH